MTERWCTYDKAKLPENGVWQIWSVLAKNSPFMGPITTTLAKEWESAHPSGITQWRRQRPSPSTQPHSLQYRVITQEPRIRIPLLLLPCSKPREMHFPSLVPRVPICGRQNDGSQLHPAPPTPRCSHPNHWNPWTVILYNQGVFADVIKRWGDYIILPWSLQERLQPCPHGYPPWTSEQTCIVLSHLVCYSSNRKWIIISSNNSNK